MSAQDWAGFILTILSIAGIFLAGLRWYINVQVEPMKNQIENIKEAIDDVRSETKTNGGSSMRDEIKQIKSEQEHAREKRKETKEKLDHMYDILLEYIANNKK
jgi:uncharacterized protein (DUF3084 family)